MASSVVCGSPTMCTQGPVFTLVFTLFCCFLSSCCRFRGAIPRKETLGENRNKHAWAWNEQRHWTLLESASWWAWQHLTIDQDNVYPTLSQPAEACGAELSSGVMPVLPVPWRARKSDSPHGSLPKPLALCCVQPNEQTCSPCPPFRWFPGQRLPCSTSHWPAFSRLCFSAVAFEGKVLTPGCNYIWTGWFFAVGLCCALWEIHQLPHPPPRPPLDAAALPSGDHSECL